VSTKKAGMLTTSKEWAKHLRAYWKRKFWKQERKAAKTYTKKAPYVD
jgi:hypothetical protein